MYITLITMINTCNNEFKSIFSPVLNTVHEWNIDNVDEEQVFEKLDYGVKFVIPPSSVQEGQSIDTKVQVVTPHDCDAEFPSNVESVSCFYSFRTSTKFSKPVELHLQHNVELRSQDDSKRLAFITSKGPPPYQFKVSDAEQHFNVHNNSGTILVSDVDFMYGIVWLKSVDIPLPVYSYVMTLYLKKIMEYCWQLKLVITPNLGPFIEVSLIMIF